MPINKHNVIQEPVRATARAGRQGKTAYTLVEIMVAMAIMGVAMTLGLSGWVHILVGQKRVEAQNNLDMDVRTSVERLRTDIRVSDLNRILFWPAGVGPYTALSFPTTAQTSPTNLLSGSGTNIIWNQTVIYHVFISSPNQLKRTVFYNRDDTATASNRQTQLDRVVADGHGNNACLNNETTSTSLLFANLFEWSLTPSTARFDCYAASTMRDRVLFGSVPLNSGSHTVEFKVIGKNPAGNSNYYLGIDLLNCSASGSDQEAEMQPFAAMAGSPSLTRDYIPTGSWGGEYQVRAVCANNDKFSITVQNDCWTENNFDSVGALAEGTYRDFDMTLSPIAHYVQRLIGATGSVWQTGAWTRPAWFEPQSSESVVADTQCRDTLPDNMQSTPLDVCARVLIRGEYIRKPAFGPILIFNKTTDDPVLINPTFAQANVGAYANTCDAVSNTVQALRFYQDGVERSWEACDDGNVYALPVSPVTIYPNQSYLVSYYMTNATGSSHNMYHNEDYRNPMIGSYMLTNVSPNRTSDAIWSTNDCLTTDYYVGGNPGKVYSLNQIASGFTSNGIYTSRIFDSGQSVARAKTITWSNSVPNNTWLNLYARTGNAMDMSDAPDWSALTALVSPGAFANNTGRYIQFRAEMGTNPLLFPCPPSPKLIWVSFNWTGDTKLIDVSGYLTRGMDYAQCEVTVDGNPLVRAIRVDLEIYKDVRGINGGKERFTSSTSAEVFPRNTGM